MGFSLPINLGLWKAVSSESGGTIQTDQSGPSWEKVVGQGRKLLQLKRSSWRKNESFGQIVGQRINARVPGAWPQCRAAGDGISNNSAACDPVSRTLAYLPRG